MKKDKLSGWDKFYGYSTEGLIARTKKEKKELKDNEKSLPKPLHHLTSEEIKSLPFFSYHPESTPKEIRAEANRYKDVEYAWAPTNKRQTKKKKKKNKEYKFKKRRKINIEGKNIIEKFFNIIAIIWMDTPVGMVISIALIVLLAIIINGGSMDSGAPSFFTDTE